MGRNSLSSKTVTFVYTINLSMKYSRRKRTPHFLCKWIRQNKKEQKNVSNRLKPATKCIDATDSIAESFCMESLDFFQQHSKIKQTNDRSTDWSANGTFMWIWLLNYCHLRYIEHWAEKKLCKRIKGMGVEFLQLFKFRHETIYIFYWKKKRIRFGDIGKCVR